MSGIGGGHNKIESCKGCPDRCADPNCHECCEGYLFRQRINDEKKAAKIAVVKEKNEFMSLMGGARRKRVRYAVQEKSKAKRKANDEKF